VAVVMGVELQATQMETVVVPLTLVTLFHLLEQEEILGMRQQILLQVAVRDPLQVLELLTLFLQNQL
jgi:hypothetical protein